MSCTQQRTTDEKYSDEIINKTSRFLCKLLRHGQPDEVDLHVNSRGWASGKQIRVVLQEHLNTPEDTSYSTSKLLSKVLENDDGERFQVITDDPMYTMVRARHGHTIDHVELYDNQPEQDDLQTFILAEDLDGYREDYNSAYIEAENEDIAKQIFIERRLDNQTFESIHVLEENVATVDVSRESTPMYFHSQDARTNDLEGEWEQFGPGSEYIYTSSRETDRL